MSSVRRGSRSSILASFPLWFSVAFGFFLVVLVSAGLPALPIVLLGTGWVIGGIVHFLYARLRPADPGDNLPVESALADHRELSRLYRVIGQALATISGQPEGAIKDAATQKLIALGVQFQAVTSGAGVRGGTESWYVAHDAVLGGPDLREYRAVIRVPTPESPPDSAARESLHATFAAARRGVLVERILVLPERTWPIGQLMPTNEVLPWIEEQHNHRLRVILVREGDLALEPDLTIDTCVFDDWAVGTRYPDDVSGTSRVALDFTPATVRAALDRLDRLSNLGISYRDLLDRAEAQE